MSKEPLYPLRKPQSRFERVTIFARNQNLVPIPHTVTDFAVSGHYYLQNEVFRFSVAVKKVWNVRTKIEREGGRA
jgi:hypothetical protein